MMKINIVSMGKLKEKFFIDAAKEYEKRLKRFADIKTTEISAETLPDNPSKAQIEKALLTEAEKIEKATLKRKTIALCVEGEELSSEDFSKLLKEQENAGNELAFVIGSSYGLSDTVKQKAFKKISFSKMTFPHRLFRIMLLEQIYRAFKIGEGSKYHK